MSTTQAELSDRPTLTVGAANKTIVQRMDLIAAQTAYDRTFLDMLNAAIPPISRTEETGLAKSRTDIKQFIKQGHDLMHAGSELLGEVKYGVSHRPSQRGTSLRLSIEAFNSRLVDDASVAGYKRWVKVADEYLPVSGNIPERYEVDWSFCHKRETERYLGKLQE